MATATCNACNVKFVDDEQKRLHYRSDWHRFNLKRKVAGVPGVTEPLFLALQTALGEGSELAGTPIYGCALCGKEYRSSRAHAQHLASRSHLMRASETEGPDSANAGITVVKIKPLAERRGPSEVEEDEEWIEELADESTSDIKVDDQDPSKCGEEPEELDPLFCFMCDLKHDTVEDCMAHMHKKHGFFIPDSEYLKDPNGLLTYAGKKVKRDFICLYCDDRRLPFQSLEAVRKHMEAKGHCKLRYGDGDDEDADLEDFYDYSSSYVDVEGKQLIAAADVNNSMELGIGGSELVITTKVGKGRARVRTLGSREFIRYYRQKPRPSAATNCALALSHQASSYKSIGYGDSSA